jgi:hypothetical protein
MGVGGQRHAPAALPLGMTRYPLYRKQGRPQGRSGRVLKISPSPGFHPRTVQLVASRYTDYAIPAHHHQFIYILNLSMSRTRRIDLQHPQGVHLPLGGSHCSNVTNSE